MTSLLYHFKQKWPNTSQTANWNLPVEITFFHQCTCSALFTSFEIDCSCGLWTWIYEYEPPPNYRDSDGLELKMWQVIAVKIYLYSKCVYAGYIRKGDPTLEALMRSILRAQIYFFILINIRVLAFGLDDLLVILFQAKMTKYKPKTANWNLPVEITFFH
jgi:hypothetical protein